MREKEKQLEQLIDFVEGRLDPEESSSIKAQIENDPVLQKMMAVIKGLRDEVDQIDWQKMQTPSHALFDRLLKDVKSQKGATGERRGITVFDSGLLPLPEGVRASGVDTRRLKYLIGDAQLEISIYPISPGSYELIGQISKPEQIKSLSVELCGGKSTIKTKANQFNLFRFPRVPVGAYNLKLFEGRSTIGIINFEL